MQKQDHSAKVKSVELFWIILRIMTIKDNEKRDIHSISLNDIGDSIKFFGVLLKTFNVEK